MKELLMYRHAKAARSGPGTPDRERQLSPEGERQAESIGRTLKEMQLLPDIILTSDAARAVATARITAEAAGCAELVQPLASLFDADADVYEHEIRAHGGKSTRIMLVGHNPTMEEFVERLARRRIEMKTGYLVRARIGTEAWELFDSHDGADIKAVISPRE